MGFTIRTTKPSNNKFYITDEAGGYSTCIVGNPTDANANVLANCVGYACGRFNEIIGSNKYKYFNCNAESFINRAKEYYPDLEIGQIPKEGAIMVWAKGKVGVSSDGAGHVAIVEKVYDNNKVYTSESGYGSTAFWNSTRSNSNGRWGTTGTYSFLGFIYNPAVGDAPVAVDPFPGVSDEELAARVWAGEFGTGNDRKNALGIRYDAVQALVDQGIGKPTTPEPTPTPTPEPSPSYAFNIGDKVIVNGALYKSSNATSSNGNASNKITTITRRVDGAKHPYNTTGDLGWMDESSISKYTEPEYQTYTVQSGDNLSKIAKKYGTTWQTIYNDNKAVIGSNPNLIRPGMVLVIK